MNIMEDGNVQNNIAVKLEEQSASNKKYKYEFTLEKKNMSLASILDIEMCNNLYKERNLSKNYKYKNGYFSKNIKDIFKEMYVDEMFVYVCQHMVELCENEIQLENWKPEKNCDIKVKRDKNKMYPELNQLISTNVETLYDTVFNNSIQVHNKHNSTTENVIPSQKITNKSISTIDPIITQSILTNKKTFETEINNGNQQKDKSTVTIENKISLQESPRKEIIIPEFPSNSEILHKTVNDYVKPTLEKINYKSPRNEKNTKSNIEIRLQFREFINSNISVSEILESKEFQNLRIFKEEEIANSIGVFCFEQTINPPIINGLSTYRVNYDQSNSEEKNKLLGSTNLNITCPKIMKLTSITLALAKMLRSDTLIDLILAVIRKNLLNRQMNKNHTIDKQLITQTVYYVDICIRLKLLKTLQTFIFDSMVMLPNKYCCVIFICLLLWTNCLPKRVNDKQDPVIIIILSCLIAKKKLYSEQTVGCDIFQRELMNLLSFHFNYNFSVDLPTNFIQHVNKPDFFISVVIFLKCCNPKDLAEFIINCLFPIIDDYLTTQQNETNAIKLMETINISLKPFNMSCNATVATYLNKCKGLISSSKKNEKEHTYNTMYHNYRILQTKFIEYLNDNRSRSQMFEESLVSIIMLLGSVDFATSCATIIKWKPIFKQSTTFLQKLNLFKSIMDCVLWDKLCLLEDTTTIKCLINSCLLKKNVYNTILQIQAIHLLD